MFHHTGKTQGTFSTTVVQWPTASNVHPGDSVTLRCSVLSESQNKTCSRNPSVYWFRAETDGSRPTLLYTTGNRPNECNASADTQKSCVYGFSKNFDSFDGGTYYCAVIKCSQILFGSGTKVDVQGITLHLEKKELLLIIGISLLLMFRVKIIFFNNYYLLLFSLILFHIFFLFYYLCLFYYYYCCCFN